MKKTLLFLTFIPLLSFSCNKSNIDIPKSPFKDSYNRIGMRSEYDSNVKKISDEDYSLLKEKTDLNNYKGDALSCSLIVESQVRDLKYAYFGESSPISQCTMDSRTSKSLKYDNLVTIVYDDTTNQKQQDKSIIPNRTITDTYTFSTNKTNREYQVNTKKTYNSETPVVIPGSKKTYEEGKENDVFGITPYATFLSQHFKEEGTYKFKFFGENAVYGTIDNDNKYIIKEAYSLFDEYTTRSGRKYKSCDNYFYEGILIKKEIESEKDFIFTNLRFYKEKLILSEAVDDTGIPVLYLERPVLVEYSETKYSIAYESLGEYKGDIPGRE